MNKFKFVSSLTESQQRALKKVMKTDPAARVRMRAHSILLSAEGFTIDEISEIYQVDRDTVSNWINKWEQYSFEGLRDKKGGGKKPILTATEQELAKHLLETHPQHLKQVLQQLEQHTGKRISRWTLKRIAKKFKLFLIRIQEILGIPWKNQDAQTHNFQKKVVVATHVHLQFVLAYIHDQHMSWYPKTSLQILGYLSIELRGHDLKYWGLKFSFFENTYKYQLLGIDNWNFPQLKYLIYFA